MNFIFPFALTFLGFFPAPPLSAESSPVIVELFTSQGCSSCPPAEEVFSSWGMNAFKNGQIIPLSFHVDYWDSLGWKDPFSSPQATARQERYASVFKGRSLYTPQMVISGKSAFVGSDAGRARKEADRFSKAVSASVISVRHSWRNGALAARITVTPKQEPGGTGTSYRIMAAVFENGLVTRVQRGENAGKTLLNDFVVRAFADTGIYNAGPEPFSQSIEFAWNADWKKENSGLAVFIQNQETFETGAAACVFPVNAPA